MSRVKSRFAGRSDKGQARESNTDVEDTFTARLGLNLGCAAPPWHVRRVPQLQFWGGR
jgi:hypothetical protein